MAATGDPPDVPDEVAALDALSSETAREILVRARREERTAEELAERCGVSLPTVYRHLDDLVASGLLVERTNVDAEGNHYKTVETAVEELCLTVTTEGIELTVEETHRDLIDRFEALWRGLEGGGGDG